MSDDKKPKHSANRCRAVWKKHDRLSSECAADFLALAMSLEFELAEARAQRDAASALAGQLIAMIRINAMHRTWTAMADHEIDRHLRPWVERLSEIIKPTNTENQ